MIVKRNADSTYHCEQDGRTWDIPSRSHYQAELDHWTDMPRPSDAEVLALATGGEDGQPGRVHPYFSERTLAMSNLMANLAEIDEFEAASKANG